jgi:hypothetical protein
MLVSNSANWTRNFRLQSKTYLCLLFDLELNEGSGKLCVDCTYLIIHIRKYEFQQFCTFFKVLMRPTGV